MAVFALQGCTTKASPGSDSLPKSCAEQVEAVCAPVVCKPDALCAGDHPRCVAPHTGCTAPDCPAAELGLPEPSAATLALARRDAAAGPAFHAELRIAANDRWQGPAWHYFNTLARAEGVHFKAEPGQEPTGAPEVVLALGEVRRRIPLSPADRPPERGFATPATLDTLVGEAVRELLADPKPQKSQ